MYAAFDDPYCYAGSSVLINKLDIRDAAALEAFEAEITAQRAAEPFPQGALDAEHFLAIHRHLFQDVYSWAGRPRTIRIGKDGHWFAYPEHIPAQLTGLFDWLEAQDHLRDREPDHFSEGAAHLLGELNAIHAFRDGNGRAQLSFVALLSTNAGHPLDIERIDPAAFLAAMIRSFAGDERALAARIRALISGHR